MMQRLCCMTFVRGMYFLHNFPHRRAVDVTFYSNIASRTHMKESSCYIMHASIKVNGHSLLWLKIRTWWQYIEWSLGNNLYKVTVVISSAVNWSGFTRRENLFQPFQRVGGPQSKTRRWKDTNLTWVHWRVSYCCGGQSIRVDGQRMGIRTNYHFSNW